MSGACPYCQAARHDETSWSNSNNVGTKSISYSCGTELQLTRNGIVWRGSFIKTCEMGQKIKAQQIPDKSKPAAT